MTLTVIVTEPRGREARPAPAHRMLAPRIAENPIQVARAIASGWRDREAWEALEGIDAFILAATRFVADAADGEPTWEDAAWQ
jgi:hypothetical protein